MRVLCLLLSHKWRFWTSGGGGGGGVLPLDRCLRCGALRDHRAQPLRWYR